MALGAGLLAGFDAIVGAWQRSLIDAATGLVVLLGGHFLASLYIKRAREAGK